MNLDQTTIVVRSRGVLEVYDLALLVVRRHAWRIAVMAMIGMLPWIALDAWLLSGARPESGWGRWWPLLLLVMVQTPLATAPLTAFLGEAMFGTTPSLAQALRTAWRGWWSLLLAGLWRGVLTCTVIGMVWLPVHVVEVTVLERLRTTTGWRRSTALNSAAGTTHIAHLLLALPLLIAGVMMVLSSLEIARGLLLHADPWLDDAWSIFNPGHSAAPVMAVWCVVAYQTVVRFLAYIDLRTRHEGWELGLMLKRAAAQVDAGA